MSRKYTLSEMRAKNKAAGHYWYQGMTKKYRDAYNIKSEHTYYDGSDNWICVTYGTGRKSWYYFNPTTGHISPVNADKVPMKIREKA